MSIPAGSVPEFDELYVISDLHLGGMPGFQIFNAGKEAERLILHLRTTSPEKRVALVINGDLVDFLAEAPARHFDPLGAVAKLNRIAGDSSFKPVWRALQQFAATKNRCLVINLGNHDVELALPWVRARLLEILSDGKEAACARIVLTFDGAGFRCRVGKAEILCVHGNEVDTWNVTDHEKIRRIGRDIVQGRAVESWIPNAGTQLVIDVMNALKSKYPFIDLLKPEVEAVVPALLALAPDQRDKVGAVGATARRLAWDQLRRATGLLGAGDEPAGPEAPAVRREGPFVEIDRERYAAELLRAAEERMRRGVDPMALVTSDQREGYLGAWGAAGKLFRGESRPEVLREALEDLAKDRSFDLDAEDAVFRELDELVGDVDFLVAGHTHLERALRRRKRSGWYFNSGTWVRLIRLDRDVLEDKERFGEVFRTFESGKMADLDAFPNLVQRRLTVVAFRMSGAGTQGALHHLDLAAADLLSSPVAEFTRS